MLCEQFDAMNKYSDVYLGWTGWSAGMFATSYELSEVPTKSGSSWTDKQIVTKCVAGKFNK
jgi:endoglucanase